MANTAPSKPQKSPFATEHDYDAFQAPKIKGQYVPNPQTQPFAVDIERQGTTVSSSSSAFAAPSSRDYPAHVKASSERTAAPFATEGQAPVVIQPPKLKGDCKPPAGATPFAVDGSASAYTSSSQAAFNPKGVVYTGPAKPKIGDSNGGVPFATDLPSKDYGAHSHAAAGSKAAPREHVPWALHSDPPAAPEPAKTKRGMAPPQGNTQPW